MQQDEESEARPSEEAEGVTPDESEEPRKIISEAHLPTIDEEEQEEDEDGNSSVKSASKNILF